MKIAIVGMGGIGGHIGAKLARFYQDNDYIHIFFIARGAHLEKIKQDGLRFISPQEDYYVTPAIATDDAKECGKMDYIFYCTKSYDIETAVETIKPLIMRSTVIVPILNGVDGAEKMRELLPDTVVADGLAYIISAIKEPGVVEEITDKAYFLYGDKNEFTLTLMLLESICRDAGLNITYDKDIEYKVWDKFEFISCVASITTAYNITYGDVLYTEKYFEEFTALAAEFRAVGYAKGALLESEDRFGKLVNKVKSLPAIATTSMQRDFWAGKNSELESLTHYIIIEGEKLGVSTPQYKKLYEMMINKQNTLL
ncbi:MAG: 2-dehydropantoate 2-reductase [Rikenellaceae bacterium]